MMLKDELDGRGKMEWKMENPSCSNITHTLWMEKNLRLDFGWCGGEGTALNIVMCDYHLLYEGVILKPRK